MYLKRQFTGTMLLLIGGLGCCHAADTDKVPENTPATGGTGNTSSKPNVLLIIMDDMRDWAQFLGANKQVSTPNLNRLAQQGVWFQNTYCAAPFSNPSRTAIFTGLQPFTTGIYNNNQQLQHSTVVEGCVMMPEHFKTNGYTTLWSGKVFHNKPSNATIAKGWDDWECHDGGYGPWIKHSIIPANLNDGQWKNFEAWTGPDTDFPDVVNANHVIDFLGKPHDKPFFIAMGFYRPHEPYTAPKRFFDQYDLNLIQRPPLLANDLDDVPQ